MTAASTKHKQKGSTMQTSLPPLLRVDSVEEFRGQLMLYLRVRIEALNTESSTLAIAARGRKRAARVAYEDVLHIVTLARPRVSAVQKAEQGGD